MCCACESRRGWASGGLPVQAFDGDGAAREVVNLDQNGVENGAALVYGVEAVRELGEEAFDDGRGLHAEDGVEGSDHAEVGDVGGAARKDASVGGRETGGGV